MRKQHLDLYGIDYGVMNPLRWTGQGEQNNDFSAALATAGFVVIAALLAHTNVGEMNQLNHFLKNLAIAGGCLALFVSGPGTFSVDLRRR